MIIGLGGLANSGKSTAASYLAREYGFARVRFAGPLKAMVRGYLVTIGTPLDRIERMIEGDLKEEPCDAFCGRSPRYALQTCGTEWGREMIAPDFWTRAWRLAVEAEFGRGAPGIVAEDVRFPEEAEAIRSLGGRVIRIERPSAEPIGSHPSETQAIQFDTRLWNEGTVEILHIRLDGLMGRYRAQAA